MQKKNVLKINELVYVLNTSVLQLKLQRKQMRITQVNNTNLNLNIIITTMHEYNILCYKIETNNRKRNPHEISTTKRFRNTFKNIENTSSDFKDIHKHKQTISICKTKNTTS